MGRQWRHALLALVAALQATCVHPAVAKIPQPQRYLVPFVIPDTDILCVQQPTSRWSCIRVGDLRKLLGSMGKA